MLKSRSPIPDPRPLLRHAGRRVSLGRQRGGYIARQHLGVIHDAGHVFALGRVGEGNDAEPGERPVQGGVEDGGGAARVPGHTGDGSPAVGVGVGERAEGAFQGIVQGGGIDQETLWEGGGPGEQARAQRRPGDAVSGDQQGDNPGIGVGHTYPGLQQAHPLFGLGRR